MKTTNNSASSRRDSRLLGLCYIGGGIAWLLHLLLAYLLAEFGCVRGWQEIRLLGITVVAWLILLVSLFAFAGALLAAILSYRLGPTRETAVKPAQTDDSSGAFTAKTALVTNLIFAFVILVETLPVFYYLHDC